MAGDSLAGNRRSFQQAMQRFGIAFAAALDRFKALLEPAEVKHSSKLRNLSLLRAPRLCLSSQNPGQRETFSGSLRMTLVAPTLQMLDAQVLLAPMDSLLAITGSEASRHG